MLDGQNFFSSLDRDIEIAKPGCCALVVATAGPEFMSGFEAIGHSFDAAVTLSLIDNPRNIRKVNIVVNPPSGSDVCQGLTTFDAVRYRF